MTLNGVPAAVAVLPSANSTLSGSQHVGYTLSSCFASEPAGTEGITVVGLDADGNIIVGAGAPTPTLSSSDTSKATVSTPSATSPNAFVLNGPATPATPGTSFTLTAAVTPLAGGPNTTPIAANIPIAFVSCPTPAPTPTPVPTPTPTPSTTVTVTSNLTTPVAGQPIIFTASVAVVAPGTGSPTGTVTFQDGGSTIAACSAQAINSGAATCIVSLAPGLHTITATYAGSAGFLTSTSPAFTQQVSKASTIVALTPDNNPILVGQSLTLFAMVEVLVPGAGTPTGTVAFKNTGATITGCSAQPIGSGGTATCTTSVLASGPQSITAQYSGDANLIASVSGILETVNRAIPTVSLTASQPGGAGTPVQFVVTVTGVGAITPTGTVDITTQSAPATTIVPCALSGSGNTASCTVSATVGLGTTTFLAKYLGDTNYLAGTGTSASITVQSVRARAR